MPQRIEAASRGPVASLVGLAAGLGAFLLFEVQLIVGKLLLPSLGSSAGVWITCLMSYQVLLLGGYLYALGLSRLPIRRQIGAHMMVGVLALAAVLVTGWLGGNPGEWARRFSQMPLSPIGCVTGALAAGVALPFLVLAANSPLLQVWLAQAESGTGTNPYRLYAVSNAGSLLALLVYPFLVEPFVGLRLQWAAWIAGFGCFLGVLAALGLRVVRRQESANPARATVSSPATPLSRASVALWFLLAVCGCMLLMSVTENLSQGISAVPLVWIVALGAYLLSFIIGFSGRLDRRPGVMLTLLVAGVFLAWLGARIPVSDAMKIADYVLVLLLVGTFCHARLHALRPDPVHLPVFYIAIAAGGAAGGVAVGLVAPLVWNWYWEYPAALLLGVLLGVWTVWRERRGWIYRLRYLFLLLPLAVGDGWGAASRLINDRIVFSKRNYYGVIRIGKDETPLATGQRLETYFLLHGTIFHGMQSRQEPYRRLPTLYYTPDSGVGLSLRFCPARRERRPLRMGVIGLGIGTLAAYGQAGDVFRFYELDPDVTDAARDTRHFSYLSDSRATVEVVNGDARLSLEREAREANRMVFDVFAIDAFSSDAVPLHLFTKESMQLYLDRLAADGILAIHASNQYLDFAPLARGMADEFGLALAVVRSKGQLPGQGETTWILMSRSAGVFQVPAIRSVALPTGMTSRKVRPWTDDRNSVLSIVGRPP